ncbi:MAG TPA: response regulator transcription factor [Gemmatimonadaceae bacterium]
MRVLLVEDDERLSEALADGFRKHQVEVVRACNFSEGSDRALLGAFDVIVLDVMLPGGNGVALCENVRRHGRTTPILMLTARDAVEDRVCGLETGADDYVIKPIAFPELLARVRALARRQPFLAPARYRIADLEVDLRTRDVMRAGRAIELTAKEFALLECFVLHLNEVMDRATLIARVWDENHDLFTNVLEVLVGRLRRKIDAGFHPRLVHTYRGAGYRFGP